MSHDVIVAGSREWFGDKLQDDLQRHDRGQPTSDFKPPVKPVTAAKPASPSLAATPFLQTKGPGAASSSDILPSAGKAGDDKADILSTDKSDDILAPDKKADILAPEKKDDALAPGKKDDILAPGKSDDILSGDKPAADNSILSGVDDDSSAPKKADPKTNAAANKPAAAAPAPFDPEVWAQSGGWYREDFTIRYRPAGHADQFLQTWLDFAGRAYGSGLHDQMTPIFDELTSKDAVGRCTKCHSIDDAAGAKMVNWGPFDADAINNRFTNYSHKPHIELIGRPRPVSNATNCRTPKADFKRPMKQATRPTTRRISSPWISPFAPPAIASRPPGKAAHSVTAIMFPPSVRVRRCLRSRSPLATRRRRLISLPLSAPTNLHRRRPTSRRLSALTFRRWRRLTSLRLSAPTNPHRRRPTSRRRSSLTIPHRQCQTSRRPLTILRRRSPTIPRPPCPPNQRAPTPADRLIWMASFSAGCNGRSRAIWISPSRTSTR